MAELTETLTLPQPKNQNEIDLYNVLQDQNAKVVAAIDRNS